MLLMSDNETKRYPVSNGGMVYVDDHRGDVVEFSLVKDWDERYDG